MQLFCSMLDCSHFCVCCICDCLHHFKFCMMVHSDSHKKFNFCIFFMCHSHEVRLVFKHIFYVAAYLCAVTCLYRWGTFHLYSDWIMVICPPNFTFLKSWNGVFTLCVFSSNFYKKYWCVYVCVCVCVCVWCDNIYKY